MCRCVVFANRRKAYELFFLMGSYAYFCSGRNRHARKQKQRHEEEAEHSTDRFQSHPPSPGATAVHTHRMAWKSAPCLACGNTVVLKPSESMLLSVLLFAKLLHQVCGDGWLIMCICACAYVPHCSSLWHKSTQENIRVYRNWPVMTGRHAGRQASGNSNNNRNTKIHGGINYIPPSFVSLFLILRVWTLKSTSQRVCSTSFLASVPLLAPHLGGIKMC